MSASVVAVVTTLAACGSSSSGDGASDAGGLDASSERRFTGQQHPAASCLVTLESFETCGRSHIVEGSPTNYPSNPPACGDHYPVWANFQEFTKPVDDGYLVHDLEHGAVVLLYKCDGAACAPILDALRKIRDALPDDPICSAASGVRVRIVIAPDPKITGPVAAAAWGYNYNAACLDVPTLTQFVKDNYGMGPEQLCAPGQTF